MKFSVLYTTHFEKELKKLARKHASLKKDLAGLIESLEEDPEQGTGIGRNCYKIRLAIQSKGKGKSGGARVITYIVVREETVFLLSIYDKSEKETITDKEILELLGDL